METNFNRRSFSKAMALGLGALPAAWGRAPARKLKIGYTCITWGTFPGKEEAVATLEPAVRDISKLGFYAFETFPEVLEIWGSEGKLTRLIDEYELPLRSGYITTNVTDPSQRKGMVERVTHLAKVIKQYGGKFAVLAPNGVKRDSYNYKEYRSSIIAGLNDYAKAVVDQGLGTGLHQHTGTAIETRDEVYDVLQSADTKYLKFAPDVGQLQKGGADAAKVVEDFLPLVHHMHLKDYKGWDYYAGYCPLGEGKVDIVRILDMVEKGGQNPNIMVELDPSKDGPMTPMQCGETSKAYLEKLGYKFKV